MREADENLERLISRRLDGELNTRQALELERLLRDRPAARRLMDEYARNDHLAGVVLRRSLAAEPACPPVPVRRIGRRYAWLNAALVAAIAACMAMVLMWPGPWSPSTPAGPPGARRAEPVNGDWLRNAWQRGTSPPVWDPTPAYPQRQLKLRNRSVLGIRDPETGQYYILERRTQRVRTVPVSGLL